MKLPLAVSEHRKRVTIVDAEGWQVTEILPAQKHGQPVTQEERLEVAKAIVAAMNSFGQ
jgi:hypothetical protein